MGNKLSGPKRLLRWSPRRVSCKSWKGHRSEKKSNDFQWMCQMIPFQFRTLISNILKGNCCCIWNSVVVDKKGPDLCPAKYHLPWTRDKTVQIILVKFCQFFLRIFGGGFSRCFAEVSITIIYCPAGTFSPLWGKSYEATHNFIVLFQNTFSINNILFFIEQGAYKVHTKNSFTYTWQTQGCLNNLLSAVVCLV